MRDTIQRQDSLPDQMFCVMAPMAAAWTRLN
jgi:hypothetical protein